MLTLRSLLLNLGVVMVCATPLCAQQLLPLPTRPNDPDEVAIYGLGALSLEGTGDVGQFAGNPTASLAAVLHPGHVLGMTSSIFTAFNKGAGLSKTSADSFSVQSLLYPESGNTAFQLQGATMWLKPDYRRMDEANTALLRGWSIGPFVNYAWQAYSVARRGTDQLPDPRPLSLNASNIAGGIQFFWWTYRAREARRISPDTVAGNSAEYDRRLRLISSLGYSQVRIAKSAQADFRELVADPQAALRFRSVVFKTALQVNDLTVSAEWQTPGKLGDASVADVPALNTELLVVRFSAAGKVFGW